jgi:hypothetical protein
VIFYGMGNHEDVDGDLDSIKLKIHNFQHNKTIPRIIWNTRKR